MLSRADFDYAVKLANTMNWNMAVEDFEFLLELEPEGCFLLLDDTKRVGIASCVSYGKVGWFGNLIVEEDYRRNGGGTALLSHAISYLYSRGVETVGLYAYPNLVGFYGKMGFKIDYDFALLHAKCLSKIYSTQLPAIDDKDFPEIAEFDAACFGGERNRLLRTIIKESGNQNYYFSEQDKIVGYIAATVYPQLAWVGPLICQPHRFDAAVSLLKSVLTNLAGKSVYVVVSKKDKPLLNAFADFGFTEEFYVSRMFLGKTLAQDCIYIAESLERG